MDIFNFAILIIKDEQEKIKLHNLIIIFYNNVRFLINPAKLQFTKITKFIRFLTNPLKYIHNTHLYIIQNCRRSVCKNVRFIVLKNDYSALQKVRIPIYRWRDTSECKFPRYNADRHFVSETFLTRNNHSALRIRVYGRVHYFYVFFLCLPLHIDVFFLSEPRFCGQIGNHYGFFVKF